MKLKILPIIKYSFVVMLLLISCQPETENSIGASDTVATRTIVPPSVTPTKMVLLPTATVEIEAEATDTPVATAKTTPLPTLTPLPTFAPDELDIEITNLLANPMNCDVPCWWGAIPGTTTVDEIKHALAPYNFDISDYDDGAGGYYSRLGIGYDEERNDFESVIVYGFSGTTLTDITTDSPSISEILTKYGQPDEIMLSAENNPREDNPLIWFTIVYQEEGIGIGYVVRGEHDYENGKMIGCVSDKTTERLKQLHLVAPNSATGYKDFSTIFSEESSYLPLEEATGLTIEDFGHLFKDPTQPQCIETPIELWE